jgi:hypothetical protein
MCGHGHEYEKDEYNYLPNKNEFVRVMDVCKWIHYKHDHHGDGGHGNEMDGHRKNQSINAFLLDDEHAHDYVLYLQEYIRDIFLVHGHISEYGCEYDAHAPVAFDGFSLLLRQISLSFSIHPPFQDLPHLFPLHLPREIKDRILLHEYMYTLSPSD